MEQIRAALQSGDVETAARIAHTVKGVSGNLGGESLYRAAAELEKAIKEGKENLDHLMTEFGSQLKMVMDGIRDFEESLGRSGSSREACGGGAGRQGSGERLCFRK